MLSLNSYQRYIHIHRQPVALSLISSDECFQELFIAPSMIVTIRLQHFSLNFPLSPFAFFSLLFLFFLFVRMVFCSFR